MAELVEAAKGYFVIFSLHPDHRDWVTVEVWRRSSGGEVLAAEVQCRDDRVMVYTSAKQFYYPLCTYYYCDPDMLERLLQRVRETIRCVR